MNFDNEHGESCNLPTWKENGLPDAFPPVCLLVKIETKTKIFSPINIKPGV